MVEQLSLLGCCFLSQCWRVDPVTAAAGLQNCTAGDVEQPPFLVRCIVSVPLVEIGTVLHKDVDLPRRADVADVLLL